MLHAIAKRCVHGLIFSFLALFTVSAAWAQASLSITVQPTPTSEEDAQGRITYTATVTNSGVGVAKSLVVTFIMPYIELPIFSPNGCVFTYNGPLYATCQLGDVAASGGQATAVVVVYPTNVGNLFVEADASESGGAKATVQGGSTVTGVGIADVAVFLDANPNPARVGAPLTYTMTAFNVGDDDARDVVVNLALPPGVKFVSATKGCSHSVTLVNCKVGHMVVSGSSVFKIVVEPSLSGWAFATALLRAESVADPSTLNNSVGSRIWVNP